MQATAPLFAVLLVAAGALGWNETKTCDELKTMAVDAYLEERFADCIELFQRALRAYAAYARSLANCRVRCAQEADAKKPLQEPDIDNLYFFEKMIRSTLCGVKCKNESPEVAGQRVGKDLEDFFEAAKPYEYLHSCYFQKYMVQDAASAAFTYLASNPGDEILRKALTYYSSLPETDTNEIVNLEAKEYVNMYVHGAMAYERENWRDVVNYMEQSLESYLMADEECRALCEGSFDHGWLPEFRTAIANHFTYCLKCKRRCSDKLNMVNGVLYDDLLPSHFHYLQFAYFKLGRLKEACQAATNYLLFYPKDETMLENVVYYKTQVKEEADNFRPTEEILLYYGRQKYEQRLLDFVETEFSALVASNKTNETGAIRNVTLTKKEDKLYGERRFVADGLLDDQECDRIMEMAGLFATAGDGYGGQKHPLTEMEDFFGLGMREANFLAYLGLLDIGTFRLFVGASESVRNYVSTHFNLDDDLYFSYTHLVCRSAWGSPNRTDLSHPVHGDNCLLNADGSCVKEPPSYVWRDYTAIIYLNGDFDGGEFIFSGDANGKVIQSSVKPKCGRIVGFSAGAENLHGVLPVIDGTRCAIGLWFTHSNEYREQDMEDAKELLDNQIDETLGSTFFNGLNSFLPNYISLQT